MKKNELIEHIAGQADLSRTAAERALDAVIDGITATLGNDGSVPLVGFGTFSVASRVAQAGRNPRTGARITIEPARVPKFRAGKSLRDAVNRIRGSGGRRGSVAPAVDRCSAGVHEGGCLAQLAERRPYKA